jgi:hypothetical protein
MTSAATAKIAGILFDFGDRQLVIPPIKLTDLQQLQDRLAAVKGGIDGESVTTVIDATHASLKRNYPEMTRDEVADLLDVGNMMDVFTSVMDVSGLKRKAQGGATGEATAHSTGPDSTQA